MVDHPLSKNEQHHALGLALLSWNRLAPAERKAIEDLVQDRKLIPEGTEEHSLAEQILQLAVN